MQGTAQLDRTSFFPIKTNGITVSIPNMHWSSRTS